MFEGFASLRREVDQKSVLPRVLKAPGSDLFVKSCPPPFFLCNLYKL